MPTFTPSDPLRSPDPPRFRGAVVAHPGVWCTRRGPPARAPAGPLIMNRILDRAAAAALALLLLTAGAVPASAASYEYDRERARAGGSGKAGGCASDIMHWHKTGSKTRGVGCVYASTNSTAGDRAHHARWLYQRPGGKLTAASGWKRAPRVNGAGFMETHWGKNGRTGPHYPVRTKICVQIKETGKQACVTLT